ncbi:PQQ-dependent sugar dehydrogenase [Brevibacillus sp. H7]|uniref:PQQ-dependent sugar dehydrogenase n=1 Tax=Brevibacillus sp. H7 TaxID=3349138 RepID=UPI0038072BBF
MKNRWVIWIAAAVLLLTEFGCESKSALQPVVPYTPDIVAENLDVPWALDFAPDGRIFFTERPGTVRVIQGERLLPQPVISFPAPFVSEGEGGLLGLVIDPDFAANRFLYVYHTYRDQGMILNRVVRLREQNNRATVDKVLIDRIPGGRIHNGGRLKIGPDRRLYITTGDAGFPQNAQDLSSLGGKILRLNLDGTIPADNPFPGSPVYSWGHRNPQGIAWNPVDGRMYSSEHGASANDEINGITPGANYGWPIVQGSQQASGMSVPLLHSGSSTWAPSGMTYVTTGPWSGSLLVASLRGEQILQIDVKSRQVRSFFQNTYGRIRDVIERSDGSLYILTSNRDGRGEERTGDDKMIRLMPARP